MHQMGAHIPIFLPSHIQKSNVTKGVSKITVHEKANANSNATTKFVDVTGINIIVIFIFFI